MQKDARMAAPNQITPVQLSRLIGTPDAPALVDVRLEDDFTQNPALIPASFRHVHTGLPGLPARIGGAKSVIICQHGRKLSEGVAALLRSYGCAAEVLEGGADGWAAAASVGLSRMFRDDLQQLEAGMPLYDALYRWARDGFDEGHDWPAGRGQ